MKNNTICNGVFFALVVLLLIGIKPLCAQQQNESYKLAVYTTGIDEAASDNKKLSSVMITIAQNKAITQLTATGKYKMIERSFEFMKAIEKEQQQQSSGDVADDQISKIGASYGAEKICVVSIAKMNAYLYVATRIVDVELKTSFEAGDAENANYQSPSDLTKCVESAIDNMLGGKSGSSSSAPRTFPSASTNFTFGLQGKTYTMVYVQGGTFSMGSYSGDDGEKPVHTVTLSDYYIGEYEVTQGLWQAVMGTSISDQRNKANTNWPLRGTGSDYPMYYVNYEEALEFCGRLNKRLRDILPNGYSFCLPTEAQWEYAATGGNKSHTYTYAGNDDISKVAWYTDNSGNGTHEVGLKAANELGLYDMSGNVWEWCSDWYGSYSSSSLTDPPGPSSGSRRVYRGGGWYNNARRCRSTDRDGSTPGSRYNGLGFRLSLSK